MLSAIWLVYLGYQLNLIVNIFSPPFYVIHAWHTYYNLTSYFFLMYHYLLMRYNIIENYFEITDLKVYKTIKITSLLIGMK